MNWRGRRVATAVLAVAMAGLWAGTAQAAARPDLSITRGSVRVGDGRITGSFTVRTQGSGAGRVGLALSVDGAVRRRYAVRLAAGATRTVRISLAVPTGLPANARIRVCADPGHRIRERSESNNCRTLTKPTATDPAPPGQPSAPSGGGGAAEPATTGSSVPTAPIPFTPDQTLALSTYWVRVPSAYDATHATPTQLLVWLHGCGGEGRYDIDNVAPAPADRYVAIAVGGREGGCWDVEADQAKVLAAIADVETHFNIDKRRIVLAGYSSGGDLSYRTAFYHANVFAGILVANTTPFRDTGSSASASIAAAAWNFPVVQLAHTADDTYPIATVRSETATLRDAGFPVTLVERPGTHYDDPGPGVPGTDADIRTILLPHLRDGWTSPG